MPRQHIVNSPKDGLDSFWKIAERYGVSFQELKQINKGRGTKTGGYPYEERKPSYGLNNGDVVILPAKQPPNKEHGDCVGKCLMGNLIVYVRTKTVAISDATVEINGPKTQSGNTDTVGKVAFKQIPPGTYKVIAKKDSLTAKGSAVVLAGDTKEITLILCVIYQLDKSFLIAKAIDTYLTPIAQFPVGDEVLDLGQDVTHAANRTAPQNYSVGTDESTLRSKQIKPWTRLLRNMKILLPFLIVP